MSSICSLVLMLCLIVKEIFGTFNRSTASPAEITLSRSMQAVWANFIKDPRTSPDPEWKKWRPDNSTRSLARLGFDGKVGLADVVQASPSELYDTACGTL